MIKKLGSLVLAVSLIMPMSTSQVSAKSETISDMEGDQDYFGTGESYGALIYGSDVKHETDDGVFDSLTWVGIIKWTHSFTPLVDNTINHATLTIVSYDIEDNGAGDGKGGEPYDDLLLVDGVEIPGAFDDVYTQDERPKAANTTTFNLDSSLFEDLKDGNVEIEIKQGGTHKDYLAIDYAVLDIQYDSIDSTPPQVNSIKVNEGVLWPPNHKMVPIRVTIDASDDSGEDVDIKLISITSNEPDEGLGDGDTVNDIQGAEYGTNDTDFSLRSERSGNSDGREYTITYTITDKSGNSIDATVTVLVPHSMGKDEN